MSRQKHRFELGKMHFMEIEGIVLGHKIYAVGLEDDQAKIYVIETLMPPTIVKGIFIEDL